MKRARDIMTRGARTVTPDPADPLDRKVQPLAAAAVVALALVVVWWWRRSRGR